MMVEENAMTGALSIGDAATLVMMMENVLQQNHIALVVAAMNALIMGIVVEIAVKIMSVLIGMGQTVKLMDLQALIQILSSLVRAITNALFYKIVLITLASPLTVGLTQTAEMKEMSALGTNASPPVATTNTVDFQSGASQ